MMVESIDRNILVNQDSPFLSQYFLQFLLPKLKRKLRSGLKSKVGERIALAEEVLGSKFEVQ
jgi:hypothetical protein